MPDPAAKLTPDELALKVRGGPATVASLTADFRQLGVKPGEIILLHSSLSAMGTVCGGAHAVILALEEALTPSGTLVMTTQSTGLSDPSGWKNPPIPEVWWQVFRDNMPAYDVDLTPARGVGIIPETFRKQRGVLRSDHPSCSFAAWGREAAAITRNHALDDALGEGSPLARMYDLDARTMLLGCDHEASTSCHLAEYRADWPGKKAVLQYAPMLVKGVRQWVEYKDINFDSDDFGALGKDFKAARRIETGLVGCAETMLMSLRELVDFAVKWLPAHRASHPAK